MKIRSAAGGSAALVILLTAGAAQCLTGSDTVFTDDIVNGQVFGSDIANSSITSAKIYNNTITGIDVNEATLAIPKIYTTRIRANGSKHSGAASSSVKTGTDYDVTFPVNVNACSAHATPATFPVEDSSSVQVNITSATFQGTVSDNVVRVAFWAATTGSAASTDFNLTLVCPAPAVIR